jgi:hypothetical protein
VKVAKTLCEVFGPNLIEFVLVLILCRVEVVEWKAGNDRALVLFGSAERE